MRKSFYLAENYSVQKGFRTIKDLNALLNQVGINFHVESGKNKKLMINVDEDLLKHFSGKKTGRPVKYHFDYEKIQKMQKEGMSNVEIYTELGMSKSLFYQKLREYKKIMEGSRTEQNMK